MGTAKSRKDKAKAKEAADAYIEEQRMEVVRQLAEDMMNGGKEWMKPWASGFAARNPVSKTVYSGMNRMHLAWTSRLKGYRDNRWVTFRQAAEKGWHVRKGEHGTRVEFWKAVAVIGKDDEQEGGGEVDPSSIHTFVKRVRTYTVFNYEQIEGAPEYVEPDSSALDGATCAVADLLIESSRCIVEEHMTDVACYYPAIDVISVPLRGAFGSAGDFVATLAHEMTHSTGHPSCLNRPLAGRFGSAEYASEELVAELGSLFVTSWLGVDGDAAQNSYDNHVAYLRSWAAKVMSGDTVEEATEVLFRAATQAERARVEIIGRYDAAGDLVANNGESQAA